MRIAGIDYSKVPNPNMVEALENYIDQGFLPGGFLTAVLEDSLSQAIARADSTNIALLKEWAQFCYWHLPSIVWGSPEKVKNWSKSGGLVGQKEKTNG